MIKMLNREEHNSLGTELENVEFLIKDNNIYFKGLLNIGMAIEFETLCKVEIKKKKQYFLNKNRNLITDSIEMFNEYLQKKKLGVRGYKTIKMGVIDNYFYSDRIEYAVVGGDIDGYHWMTDRESKIKVSKDTIKQIVEYIESLSSEFICA